MTYGVKTMFENLPILKVFHPPMEVDEDESGGFTYFRVCEGGNVVLGDDEGKVMDGKTYSYFHSSILSLLASMLLLR